MGAPHATPIERVLRRIVIDASGCWLWPGSTARGYGKIDVRIDGRRTTAQAHRVVYEACVGPIPDGMQLDHVKARGCVHRHCCNPDHLEPVTPRENTLRGDTFQARNASKTHCPRGHEYDVRRASGSRACSVCRNAQSRRAA